MKTMTLQKVHSAFFSATGTTAKIVAAIASGTGVQQRDMLNFTAPLTDSVAIPNNEVVIFGVPVFAGRVPEIAMKSIEKITGNNTPAIIVCVYGNRDFDDALIELKEAVERNGFYVLSAAAFIAQHSIFSKVAHGRPDEQDIKLAHDFGRLSVEVHDSNNMNNILVVKGNHPYKEIGTIPLIPSTDRHCTLCGLCADLCPVQAIDFKNPKKIDKNKCIPCGHCISICPNHSKKFKGLIFRIASHKFVKTYSDRKEPYIVYRTGTAE
jgi:ferredoxin